MSETETLESLETDRETRRLLNAITTLNRAEPKIAECRTVDEVEEIRLSSQAIQYYGREVGAIGKAIYSWAQRVAVKCQLRITEIQDTAKVRKAERRGEIPRLGYFALTADQTQANRASEARLLNSLPKEELDRHIDKMQTNGNGQISVKKLAQRVRKERGPKPPKSTPKELERARARYQRRKARKLTEAGGRSVPTLEQKFARYWLQELKLLGRFFSDSDFGALESLWLEAFHNSRKEAEQARQERAIARAKLQEKLLDTVGAAPSNGTL